MAALEGTETVKEAKKPKENGGRYGYEDYPEAPTFYKQVEGVATGDVCEQCAKGRYYAAPPRKLVSFTGGPSIEATRYACETVRCNRCGNQKSAVFSTRKWNDSAKSAVVINKIYGLPWLRQSRMQALYGVPVAPSTLWHLFYAVWEDVGSAIVRVLYAQAAESDVLCVDDTGARILEVMAENKTLDKKKQRASHTTGICGMYEDHPIKLYVTANRYCRENWLTLLAQRKSLKKVILMSDASSQSLSKKEENDRIEGAVCLGGHGRMKFKELEDYYPAICDTFLALIATLYKHEKECKRKTKEERLVYHQQWSSPVIEEIYQTMEGLYARKEVEPNSSMGKAINYWINHKEKLTAFLRVEGAPLDNNAAENVVRMVVIYRNNSLFFKTKKSAGVISDMFSLIATCEANKVNAYGYMNWLQAHRREVSHTPEAYLPWKYGGGKGEAVAA